MASEIRSEEEVIIDGLDQLKPALMGLEKLVFGGADSETFPTVKVSVDMFDGTRGAAKYTARGAKGQTLGLEGWTTEEYQPPMIDERIVITAEDLEKREKGKGNINNPASGEEKFQKLINSQLKRKQSGWQRTYNNQIRDLITAGKMQVTEYDDKGNALAPRDIDFKMPSTHIYTVDEAWGTDDADIFGDIRAADILIQKDSGLMPDVAIVGEGALKLMVNDANFMKLLDNRRMKFGELEQEDMGDGLVKWGMIGTKTIYTFTDFDEDGAPLIPANSYIPFSTRAQTDIYYGSLSTIQNDRPAIVEATEIMESDIDRDTVAKIWKFKSAKLYGLTQSAAFANITVA